MYVFMSSRNLPYCALSLVIFGDCVKFWHDVSFSNFAQKECLMKDSFIALMLIALPVAAFASFSMHLHNQNREPVSEFQLQPDSAFHVTLRRGEPVVRTSSDR